MAKFVRNASFEHVVTGEWFPYYNWENRKPNYITLLNPELVDTKSVMGKDFVYMKPNNEVKQLLLNGDEEVKKELRKIIPEKILSKWEKGESAYLSSVKRFVNLKAYHEKNAHSPIEPIFGDLQILQTLTDADYATAKKLKQLFLHVTVGNEKFNNGKPVSKDLIKNVEGLFEDPYRAAEMVTQWFVKMEYLIPDLKIFSNEKYESVIGRILAWSGMEVIIRSGGSYSEGSIRLKSLRQEIGNIRNEIKKFLDQFNEEIAREQGFSYYGKLKTPRIQFDKSALEDPKLIADMLKYAYGMGTVSMESMHEELGYDFKLEMDRKEKENKKYRDEDVVSLLFEMSQGLLTEDESSEGDDNNNTDNNQPRP